MRVVHSDRPGAARALCALLSGLGGLLAGCHGNTPFIPGTPVLTMGQNVSSVDFASYIVTVDDITITESDGTVVTLLGTPEVVDLAKVSTLEELVEAPAVPETTYTSASITLDYTLAFISVLVNGKPVPATAILPSGTTATTVTIPVTFDPSHPLVINNQQSTRLQFTIDLAASNSINTATSPPTVTVQPFALLTPAPVDATVMRARGLFVTTQSLTNAFYMNLRPFYDLVSALGAVVVNIDANTYFNINGGTYTGAAGLAVLPSLPVDTPIAAYGTLDNLSGITPSFNATAVYAGTSLENPVYESLTGIVASRSGSTVNLLGVTYFTPAGYAYPPLVDGTGVSMAYYPSLPVTLADSTIVSEDGVAASGLNIDSISVGQQITVTGQATVDTSDNYIPESLDASVGQVRIGSTRLWGTLNSASSTSASLDLLSIGNFAPAAFDFTGTGTTAAAPSAYQVDTGTLNESKVAAGTLLAVDGVVTPFGSAPPDFQATAITPGSSTLQQLVVEWGNGAAATAPFSSTSSAGLVVDLGNAELSSAVHYIRTGPVTQDLKSLPASPLITTVGANQSNLVLAVGSAALTTGVSVFSTAAEFATGLKSALNGTNRIYRLVAYGQYNSGTNTFVASSIYVALQEST